MYNELVLIGVVISLIYYELSGWSPGGIIVPGYLALNIRTPERVAYTLIIVLVTWLLLKWLAGYVILFGQRRFAVSILLAAVINIIISLILPFSPSIIGYLVPGILANQVEKQGILPTMLSMSVVVALLMLIMLAVGVPAFG